VPELGSLGSVRGALRNERPYRECENSATRYMAPKYRGLLELCATRQFVLHGIRGVQSVD
jgi:hypothetical protein